MRNEMKFDRQTRIVFFYLHWLVISIGEIGSGPRSSSPLIDVEAVSDDENDIHNSTVGQCNDMVYIFVVYRCCFTVVSLMSLLFLIIVVRLPTS